MSSPKDDLEQLVLRLQQSAGENLQALLLYGSAARDDFNEQYSDLNLLCVLREASGAALERVAPVVIWWVGKRRHRPPLFVTLDELRASADVFAIEMLDLKATHRLLAGQDVLSGIEVPMNLHRVQLEHELRTMLLRLRQQFLLAHDEQHLEAVLAKSVSSMIVLLRHALIALGRTPESEEKRNLLVSAAGVLGLDLTAINAALDLREGRRLERSIGELYERYMQVVSSVVNRVDEAAPKRQWQRTT